MSEIIRSGGKREMAGNASALSLTVEVDDEMEFSDWAGRIQILSKSTDSKPGVSCGRGRSAHAIEAWNLGLT